MSALQISWLTNHFEQGKITQDEFTSLYNRIAQTEKQSRLQRIAGGDVAANAQGKEPLTVLRMHPETRLTLARLRSFKRMVHLANYTLLLGLISIVYLSVEYYQITGNFPAVSVDGLEKLLTQTPRKPLPSDIKLAAEYLSQESEWVEDHVYQFSENWQNTLISDRQRYSNEYWFQEFKLALSLHIVEERRLAKTGDRRAIQQAALLNQLVELLEKKTV